MMYLTQNFIFQNTMTLWRKLKLPVIPSTHLLEDHVISYMIALNCGISNKTVDHYS